MRWLQDIGGTNNERIAIYRRDKYRSLLQPSLTSYPQPHKLSSALQAIISPTSYHQPHKLSEMGLSPRVTLQN